MIRTAWLMDADAFIGPHTIGGAFSIDALADRDQFGVFFEAEAGPPLWRSADGFYAVHRIAGEFDPFPTVVLRRAGSTVLCGGSPVATGGMGFSPAGARAHFRAHALLVSRFGGATRARLYYAHPMSDYDTPHERSVEAALSDAYEVVNPNRPEHREPACRRGMPYFLDLCASCTALAFSRFPDGTIGAGVGAETAHAFAGGLPVFAIRGAGQRLTPILAPPGFLSISETRQTLRRYRSRRNGGRSTTW